MADDESPGRALPPSKSHVRRCNAQTPFAVLRSKQSSGASRTHAAREPCTPASNPHAHRVHVRPLATLAPSCPLVPPHAAHVRSVHVAGSIALLPGAHVMVLGAFVTYVSRSSCAAQPRTSRPFLRAGADFGGVSSSSAVLLAGCRSGGRVTRVALSPLCSRLKPLLIHAGSCAHM